MDSTGNIAMPILIERGTDSTRLVREGVLTAGMYRFLVQGTSFGASFFPGPASGNVHSNFAFSLGLNDVATPGTRYWDRFSCWVPGSLRSSGPDGERGWQRTVEHRERLRRPSTIPAAYVFGTETGERRQRPSCGGDYRGAERSLRCEPPQVLDGV